MSSGNKDDAHRPLELPQWWPRADGVFQFPRDSSLPTAAKALRGHLDELGSAMSALHGEGFVTAEDLGNWDAGQTLTGTVQAAHAHIGAVYREFQRQLENTAALLVKAHENHNGAEESSARASRRLGNTELPHLPGATPTQRTAPSMD